MTCPICNQDHSPHDMASACCDVETLWREIVKLNNRLDMALREKNFLEEKLVAAGLMLYA